jgi:hypothetical protein
LPFFAVADDVGAIRESVDFAAAVRLMASNDMGLLEIVGWYRHLADMRRRLAIAVTAAALILVLTSNSQYEPLNRTHCIVDELAAAAFFDR